MSFTLALVQFLIEPGAPLKNLARMEEFTAQAKAKGADLVVFPEDAVCGPLSGQTGFVALSDAYLARMQALAIKHQVDLVPGTWTVAEDGALYNQAHYITAQGLVAGSYRKIHLWETESAALAPGTVASVFTTRFGRVGLSICWDIAFPELFAAMNAQGVQLILSPSYWSFPQDGPEGTVKMQDEIHLIDSLCTTRAFENNVVFAYCNAAGVLEQGGVKSVLSGRSQVTDPLKKVIAQCEGNREELITVEVELPVQGV